MPNIYPGFFLALVVAVHGVRRSIVIPQTTVPDPSSIAPYPDTQLAQYFPTAPAINVPGIQHPYFKPAQNLPQVDVDSLTASSR